MKTIKILHKANNVSLVRTTGKTKIVSARVQGVKGDKGDKGDPGNGAGSVQWSSTNW